MSSSTLMTAQKEWVVSQDFVIPGTDQIDLMVILSKALEVSGLHDQNLQSQLETHFIQDNQTWVITQYEINIIGEVHIGDNLVIDTRLIEVNKFLCTRRYSVLRDGELVCEIFGKFAAIDMEKRRIVRINLDPLVSNDIIDTTYSVQLPKLVPFTNELDSEATEIPISENDIDENLHVNNLSYLKWAYQTMPKELVEGYKAYKIEVKYDKELLPEDRVAITGELSVVEHQRSQHLIWNLNSKSIACILNIYWEER